MMPKIPFKPFQNEAESLQIADLTLENRTDRISIYGSVDLTRDKEGLAYTRELKQIIDSALAELEKSELPDKIAVEAAETVANPFAQG